MKTVLVFCAFLLVAGAFASYADAEDNSEEYSTPSNVEEESGEDVITVSDLDKQLLPRLKWRGKSYYARTGRFLASKLRQLNRRLNNENWRTLRHMTNSRNLCVAARAKVCPNTSCQKSPACRIRSFDRRQRALHRLYSETYAAYLKVAGRYNRGRFYALAKKFLELAAQHKRLKAAYRKLRGKITATQKKYGDAKKAFDALSQKVAGCRQRLAQLNTQIRDWKLKTAALKRRLSDAERERDAHKKAADNEETKRTNAQRAAAAHKAAAAKAENEVANFCPFKDQCGVCKGDGRVCAKVQTARQCHSVGDPHFRSFDGFTYDYMTDGDFVLAKYPDVGPNRFEVQARQVGACGPGNANRCNKAFAVMANGHVLVSYGTWFAERRSANLISINGNQQVLEAGKWTHLADGAMRVRLNQPGAPATMEIFYCWNNEVCDTKVTVNFNVWGPHLDIYVQARAQLSTGHMTGLCGNYDGDINNDRPSIFNNIAQFRMSGAQSFFDTPGRRLADIDENPESDGNDEGLRAPENPLPVPEEDFKDDGEPTDVKPRHNVKIKKELRTKANEARVEKACGKLQGTEKKNCALDLLSGVPANDVKHLFAESNIMDHERRLTKCKRLTSATAFKFPHPRLPSPIPDEGYSASFWFQPGRECANGCSVLSKGEMLKVTLVGAALAFEAGSAKCSVPAQALGSWTQYTAAVAADGALQVFLNGEKACDAAGSGTAANTADDIVNGVAGADFAVGKIASVYWVPVTVEEAENKLAYAERAAPHQC